MEYKFEKVTLSGGGLKGIIQLGVLHYYYEKGLYDQKVVHTYSGTSIGSVIDLLLICGYTPMEIFSQVYTTDKFFKSEDCQSPWNIIQQRGLMSIDNFIKKIADLVEKKMGFIPTLKQLQEKTGKTLKVAVSNMTKVEVEYFSPETHPDLSSLEAVKMSSSLPLIFQKTSYNGNCYVDGGLADGFPIHLIDDGKSLILGVVVYGVDRSLKDDTLIGYIYRLINLPINTITKLRCQNLGDNVTLIEINCEDIPVLQFSMSSKEKMALFLRGYNEVANRKVDYKKPIDTDGWDVKWSW